jgi:hypothetical protein
MGSPYRMPRHPIGDPTVNPKPGGISGVQVHTMLMSKFARLVCLAGVLALACGSLWLLGQRNRSRNALELYKSELRARGEKLALVDLPHSRTAGTNASLARLMAAVGSIGSVRLQVHPVNLEPRKFVGPGRAWVIWKDDAPFRGQRPKTGPPANWNDFALEVDGLSNELAEVRASLREPAPDLGPRKGLLRGPVAVNNYVAIRTAALWLMGASLAELHRGRREAALQNLEALASLARVDRDEYTVVSQMIRSAVTSLGTATTWEALQLPDWTEPELARLQCAWESIDLLEGLENALVAERASGVELWSKLRQSSGSQMRSALYPGGGGASGLEAFAEDCLLLPAYRMTSINEDELFRLQSIQAAVTALRSVRLGQAWNESKAGLDAAVAEARRLSSSPMRLRYWFSTMTVPNCQRASDIGVRVETEKRMTVVAIAVKRYQVRHSKSPASLAELVPEFLTTVPLDCLSGRPFRYRPRADGQFLLYSVGEDGRDDGGDATPAATGKLGLWEGRDAVWPEPATELEASPLPSGR